MAGAHRAGHVGQHHLLVEAVLGRIGAVARRAVVGGEYVASGEAEAGRHVQAQAQPAQLLARELGVALTGFHFGAEAPAGAQGRIEAALEPAHRGPGALASHGIGPQQARQ